jgi:hypothetical protein
MADPASEYVLSSSGGTVTLNDGTFGADDRYHLTDIPDLDDPPLRVPVDSVPFGDGALVYQTFTGAWHIPVEGVFMVVSTRNQNSIRAIRNQMEEDLRDVLRGMKAPNAGSLAWTPLGQPARTLTVYYEIPIHCPHDQNYLLRTFSFGLLSPDANWS